MVDYLHDSMWQNRVYSEWSFLQHFWVNSNITGTSTTNNEISRYRVKELEQNMGRNGVCVCVCLLPVPTPQITSQGALKAGIPWAGMAILPLKAV